jgi:glycosyltransferase involved in cell wall biosynthesis
MKKDILFMCQFFYPEYISSGLLPYQTAQALTEAGMTVDVLCGYPNEYLSQDYKVTSKEIIDGINIIRKKYIQIGRKNFFGRLINYFSFTFVMFINIFRCRDYRTIIVYSNPPILPLVAVLAKKIFGCKIVFVAYDLYPEIAERTNVIREDSSISRVMSFINKKLYKNVSKVIALSNEMKTFLTNERAISEKKIEVIPNWATESFELKNVQNPIFSKLRKNHKLIVSYFGNMGIAQDMDTIMNVISDESIKSTDIYFIFAGHGNKKNELIKFIQDNNLKNCKIYDYLSGDDFNDALTISDLCIVSLKKDLCGLAVPSKTYSYYQAKKPVIAIMDKKMDIAKQINKFSLGFSVESNESKQLIKYLLSIQSDREKIEQMKNNLNIMYDELFLKEIQLEKYVNIFKELLEE